MLTAGKSTEIVASADLNQGMGGRGVSTSLPHRVYTLPILVGNRVWFSRELRNVLTYLSFQFQMS